MANVKNIEGMISFKDKTSTSEFNAVVEGGALTISVIKGSELNLIELSREEAVELKRFLRFHFKGAK